MKKNDWILLASTLSYSCLFYKQNAGINFLIFAITVIILLLIKNKHFIKNTKWCWAAAMVLFSSVCLIFHSSALSILANIFSLLLLSAFSFNAQTSSAFSFLFSLYSLCSSIVFVVIDAVLRNQKNNSNPDKTKSYKWIGILLVLVTSTVFFVLYKNSNPIFAEYTKWINLDFITVSWFFFTLGGFFLMYAFLYHKTISPIEKWENNLALTISDSQVEASKQKRLDTEKSSIITLFIILNLMLLVINFGDVNTLLLGGSLPKGVKHSDFVHSGVGTLIFSILLADSLIIYFLRGSLNFVKGSKYIKLLILFWVLQNILMLISTSYRNHLYISEYTLTQKRIGVYVWLGLSVMGLIITAIKVYFNKSNWYLIKTNIAVWFTVLTLCSAVDWDLLITRYNLQHKKINEIDYYYLNNLSDTNIPEMIKFCKQKIKLENVYTHKHQYEDRYYYHSDYPYINLLHYKIENYLRDYQSDWRSWDLRDKRILKSLNLN